jgi:hypothetical protein
MMVRRKSAVGELLHVVIIRRPTTIDIVSATATRRVVFTTMPIGLAVVASSDMTSSIPVRVPEGAADDRVRAATAPATGEKVKCAAAQ